MSAALLASCAPYPPEPASAPAESPATRAAEMRAFEVLVNRHREGVGCAPLKSHAGAAQVAQRHSEDMARNNYFAHENPYGESPFDRLKRAGVTFRAAAENIAYGQRSADAVMRSWLSSAGHRRNIVNCAYTHHGVGVYSARWTHVLLLP